MSKGKFLVEAYKSYDTSKVYNFNDAVNIILFIFSNVIFNKLILQSLFIIVHYRRLCVLLLALNPPAKAVRVRGGRGPR